MPETEKSHALVGRFIDVVVGNDGHHREMLQPVAERLASDYGAVVRFLSLCELRGARTPQFAIAGEAAGVRRLFPVPLGRRPGGGSGGGDGRSRSRRILRQLTWLGILRPMLRRGHRPKPIAALMPNVRAYPYDKICRAFRAQGIPVVAVQEGVRMHSPNARGMGSKGWNEASAIAAWGRSSAEHFASLGVPARKVFLTGSPGLELRMSEVRKSEVERVRELLSLEASPLVIATNPIDDLGYCTSREKNELLRRLVGRAGRVLARENRPLVIKLHRRESRDDVARAIRGATSVPVHVVDDLPLYALLRASAATLVLASTVGLEALLLGVPLGVVELPRHGFLYDYVQSGVAVGLSFESAFETNLERLLRGEAVRADVRQEYLRYHVARLEGAGEAVASLVQQIVAGEICSAYAEQAENTL